MTRLQRFAPWLGIIAPLTFLGIAFTMAVVRSEVIQQQGWASWPSSMAVTRDTGATAGAAFAIPMILAFLVLASSYPVFALAGVRPRIQHAAAWAGFLVIALGDLLLAFPTDGPGVPGASWHGILHAIGVVVATVGTFVAVIGITRGTWGRPGWNAWRYGGAPVAIVAIIIGMLGGLEYGWAKVIYVLGITLPVPVFAGLMLRDDRATARP